jgi:CDP-diacylglycerol--glycerol-3-phosphate 3-phosphatidyltransferase
MLTHKARALSRGVVEPLALGLGRTGISPNGLTVLGSALHIGVAWLIAAGHLAAGGLALAAAAAFDGLDGALARATRRDSAFGAFLDSTLDRVSEAIVFLGLLVHAQRVGNPRAAQLALVALAGSLLVSYTRARAEGIGHGTQGGVFGRLERMGLLVLGLLAGWVEATLWVLVLGAWFTVGQRVLDVRRRCAEAEVRS